VHLFNGPDRSPRINDAQGNSGPPCLSTFKRRGGGGSGIGRAASQQLRSKRPDQRHSCDPILLSYFIFNQRGPSPLLCHPPQPPLPYCHVSSVLLHSLVQVVPSPSHHSLTTCHASRSFPRQPPLKCAHCISLPAPSAYRLPPCIFPCHLPHTSSLLISPSWFWRHHPHYASHPSRWPPRVFSRPINQSRWQRKGPSTFRKC
jgi:hypothetical protein